MARTDHARQSVTACAIRTRSRPRWSRCSARDIETFVFHDDNFFVPGKRRNLERFHALADALERRGIGRFATVVKARPTVDPEVFRVLRDRLQAIRVYVGIETDSEQGLETLRELPAAACMPTGSSPAIERCVAA